MSRARSCIDRSWKFTFGHAADPYSDFRYGARNYTKSGEAIAVTQVEFDDSAWRRVDLPHDWAVDLPFDAEMPGNYVSTGSKPLGRMRPGTTIGWYRHRFDIAAGDEGRRIRVDSDGVFRDCVLWLNGHWLGRNLGGYTPFGFDVTDLLNYGATNVLTLRVDASTPEGWFYEGAGIYRHMWLTRTDPICFTEGSLFVPYDLAKDRAVLRPEATVANRSDNAAEVEVRFAVRDPAGRVVGKARHTMQLPPWTELDVKQTITLKRPQLWDLDSPKLYRLTATIHSKRRIVDDMDTNFGLRTTQWDAEQGFLLNGRHVKIKGVCCHQDHAGVGAALPDRLQSYRIERLKEMGANAYRCAHNQPTPGLLDACDRLGMLVMDEVRMCNATPEALGQLETLVRRDRNRPSVFLWSIGNEEHTIQASPVGKRIARTMKRLVRRLDPTRPVTAAMNNGGREGGFIGVIDVLGWNYIAIGDIDKWHANHPDTPLVGAEEASHLATRGVYEANARRAHVSAYCDHRMGWTSTAEQWWAFYQQRPWLAGGFAWTGFDYRGEPSPYRWPGISSHFGIMDLCGFPKDHYWYYRAWWTEEPILHLMPHWNWPDKVGQEIDVWCYSNADAVELLLNGKSLGLQVMPRFGRCQWRVVYAPGKLLARAWRGDELITEHTVATTGAPTGIKLMPDRPSIAADGRDVSVVNAAVVDDDGNIVPTADNQINFRVDGGRILGVGNGDPGSHEPDQADRRRAFNGLCQVIIQGTDQPGEMTIRATSDGLKSSRLTVNAQ